MVLVGPPTAGKSSIGALLARELGVPFADTDALVAKAASKPVGDVFVDDGERVFREFERGAVARGLESFGPGGGVLALGSGAVLDPDVRRMLAGPGGRLPGGRVRDRRQADRHGPAPGRDSRQSARYAPRHA